MSQKKSKLKAILIGLFSVLILLSIAFNIFIGVQIADHSTKLVKREETMAMSEKFYQKYHLDFASFKDRYEFEEFSIPSTFQEHQIPGDFISHKDANKGTVVLVHGLGGNRYANYPLAEFFLSEGYKVLTYDQRNSNENAAERNTFGYWEQFDLRDVIRYRLEQEPEENIAVWGCSFGGATAIYALQDAQIQEKISFLVLDCPLGGIQRMIRAEMDNMDTGLPTDYLITLGNWSTRVMFGFSYQDADAEKLATEIDVPTFVINTKSDEVTPYEIGVNIYQNIQSELKEIWSLEDSKHAEIWADYPDEYKTKLREFISSVETKFD